MNIEGRDRLEASKNMRALLKDAGAPEATISRDSDWDNGDYRAYVVRLRGHEVVVDMPDLPLDRVRYAKSQSIIGFPRLYIEGSSWLWEYAPKFVRLGLGLDADEDDNGEVTAPSMAMQRRIKAVKHGQVWREMASDAVWRIVDVHGDVVSMSGPGSCRGMQAVPVLELLEEWTRVSPPTETML